MLTPPHAIEKSVLESRHQILEIAAADWGPSDPFLPQERVIEYRRRGQSPQDAIEVFHDNPWRFLGQNPKCDISPIRVTSAEVAHV